MKNIKLIEINEEIHADNNRTASQLKDLLAEKNVFLLNVMSSPGAGKTSLILQTLKALDKSLKSLVIEADIDSLVDAEKIVSAGYSAIQIRTGGFCHVTAPMVGKTIESIDLDSTDLVILENVGNLVCPAQVDTGAHANVMILSVPEGDDKPLKYPLMFRFCEALIVNKTDYLDFGDFDVEKMRRSVLKLNPDIRIFEISCKTGQGIAEWMKWIEKRIHSE